MRSRYYGTPEELGFAESLAVYEYIVPRLGKTILRHGSYLIDINALLTPVNLDCFHCHLVHGHNCCEKGQPYSMHGDNLALFEKHAFTILETYTNDGRAQEAREKGVFEKTIHTNYYSSIRTFEENCLYLIEENGKRICAIHKYALDKGMNPSQIKPFSCSLFPLEIIECDLGLLITAAIRETESFSRWGDYYRKNYACVNPKRRPAGSPKNYFAPEGYVPAWTWARSLLATYWGERTVQEIEALLHSE
ncbi:MULTISPECIES: DUF3109 family protein [Aneurinibacillus]|uniref:DUF3109 family protein n=2 Tax=Aneurinibacillus thermoaerophilus TaxID=143495 RepID=A0A1G7WXS0_ANETH|nr:MULTISPECIES: DUF3109 family protein [Aneurinibacillus]MED0674076.1 DUF3109 family protein [Aneurinibacillus thermoaerophilus]MED0737748.1 DUF3109 family protein [Aneurinibacillus thermoaerophilus]MED0755735.1 DUF3109 family protein [Aneurinibacillus thermoaerophilus]MED0759936.1 DUF3109 family protein [Aneurinibacillus thermoaerophilus]MED0764147.1 DUF3109 family protein [Aneurinibacillus thermoaerophilus]